MLRNSQTLLHARSETSQSCRAGRPQCPRPGAEGDRAASPKRKDEQPDMESTAEKLEQSCDDFFTPHVPSSTVATPLLPQATPPQPGAYAVVRPA